MQSHFKSDFLKKGEFKSSFHLKWYFYGHYTVILKSMKLED